MERQAVSACSSPRFAPVVLWRRRQGIPTSLCRNCIQQLLANHKQIHQSTGGKHSVGVLHQSSVADLHKPELQFHHSKHVLDLRTYLRLGPVLRPFRCINVVFIPISSPGRVLHSRRVFLNHFTLPAIRLVAPNLPRPQPGEPVSPAAAPAAVALGTRRNSAHTPVQNRGTPARDRPPHFALNTG